MPEQITKWKAKDGTEFCDRATAERYEICAEIARRLKVDTSAASRVLTFRVTLRELFDRYEAVKDDADAQV